MTFRVSVLIPHYNDLQNLDVALDLLTKQTLPRDSYEIIVADNNSSAGFDAVAAVVGNRARTILVTEQGAGPARNAAAMQATAPNFAFIDSDCRPAADWLEKGLAALERCPIVGGSIGVTIVTAGMPSPVEAFELVFAFQNKRYVEKLHFSVTCNMFVRREIFDKVGGFRNHVSEDMEWGQRAGGMGVPILYDETVRIEHPARPDWPSLQRKWRRLVRETFMLQQERAGGKIGWMLRSWLVLFSAVPHTAFIWRSRQLPDTRSRWGATRVLIGLRLFRFVEAHRMLLDH